jgi:hypothetical protein
MLSKVEIDDIAKKVATANLSSTNVSSAISAPGFDSEGHEALRITIVLTPASSNAAIDGDSFWTLSFKSKNSFGKEAKSASLSLNMPPLKSLKKKRVSILNES